MAIIWLHPRVPIAEMIQKHFTTIFSSSNKLVAIGKISPTLLSVKLIQYSENVVTCFKANPIL